MRELLLTTQALADLKWWLKTNPRVALKIAERKIYLKNRSPVKASPQP